MRLECLLSTKGVHKSVYGYIISFLGLDGISGDNPSDNVLGVHRFVQYKQDYV